MVSKMSQSQRRPAVILRISAEMSITISLRNAQPLQRRSRIGVSGGCSFSIPVDRPIPVLWDALTVFIQQADAVHSYGVAPIGCRLVPLHRGGIVYRYTTPGVVQVADTAH